MAPLLVPATEPERIRSTFREHGVCIAPRRRARRGGRDDANGSSCGRRGVDGSHDSVDVVEH